MARTKKRSPTFATASAFIRSQPRSMPAKAVVASAADHGFKINEQRVYNVRSATKARTMAKAPARTQVRANATVIARSDLTPADAALIRAVADVGVARARELLGRLERVLS